MAVTFKYPDACEDGPGIPTHGKLAPSPYETSALGFVGGSVTDFKFKERRGQHRTRFEAPATVTAGKHKIAASTKDISERGAGKGLAT